MTHRTHFSSGRLFVTAVTVALPLVLAGCTQATTTASETPPAATTDHVHGIFVDPVSTKILLASHDGLYDATGKQPVKVGTATIDLMGFTPTAEPGVYYASGHPGLGSTLPNPAGLIRSADAGKSWEPVSRGGQSDFHALTVTRRGLVSYDGTLRTSTDGTNWTDTAAAFAPATLAGSPASAVVLATTEGGLQRSTDSGTTWRPVPDSPIIQFASFAVSTGAATTSAVGVTPYGGVYISADGGLTWAASGKISSKVQAVTARQDTDGKLSIWVATTDGVQLSTDAGATFRPTVS